MTDEEWFEQAISEPCPICSVGAGERCIGPNGEEWPDVVHAMREVMRKAGEE